MQADNGVHVRGQSKIAPRFPFLLAGIWAYTLSEVPFLYGLFEGFPILAIAPDCDRTNGVADGAGLVGGIMVGVVDFWTAPGAELAGRSCAGCFERGLGAIERAEGRGICTGPGVGDFARL
jgi:hypothetical protein